MTVQEAQRELERVGAELDTAIEQLVGGPSAVDPSAVNHSAVDPSAVNQWPATLKAAAAALQNAKEQLPPAGAGTFARETFTPLLERIQTRVSRVHMLLESAALFYCGCVARAVPEHAGYAADGALQQSAAGGRMQLEA